MLAALSLAVLAALGTASPVAELETRQNQNNWITWRHGGTGSEDYRILVTCGGGPYVGHTNGDQLSLATDYLRYCSPTWAWEDGKLVGSSMCLDATLNPGNGVQPHMWECYDDYETQQWTKRADGLIEWSCSGLCLDVTDGDARKRIQLWECDPNNPNQQWNM